MAGASGTESATARAGAPVVLATKLHPPSGRPDLVPRPALVERLSSGLRGRLTLVAAPPGWGKTILLGEWCAQQRRSAWLTFDRGDNDSHRMWTYVVEAIRTVEPEVGTAALAQLRGPSAGIVDVVLAGLLNELALLDGRLILVLDDYHLVTSAQVHEQLGYFVEHLPPELHLVVSTRADPPLPIARLRARGELSELRAADLRFSAAEAGALLNEALALELDTADVERLVQRTEGWAGGLYLAALSLRGRDDADRFIRDFAGDDRHIVDYLSSEVLESQPVPVQMFLLRTSVLERLCGPLCDAVVGGSRSAEMLEEMERSNLFLIPLDNTREWYRYHRLFSELLRHELSQREPELQPVIHRRAWTWLRDAGLVSDAVHHAIAAGDVDDAAQLVAQHWNAFFNQGELATVSAWLDALERAGGSADPRLAIARAWIAMDVGRLDEVERWIDAAAGGLPSGPMWDGTSSLEEAVATLRLVHRFKIGDVQGANQAARRAIELEPGEAPFGATVARILLGVTRRWSGDAAGALPALEAASELATSAGNFLAAIYALGYWAAIHAEAGELDEAAELVRKAFALADDPARGEHFVTMMAYLAEATVLREHDESKAAEAAARRGVELSRRGAGLLEAGYALLVLARTLRSAGDLREAERLLVEVRQVVDRAPDPGILADMLSEAEAEVRAGRRSRDGARAAVDGLSDRELTVLRLLSSELSQREIGAQLYVSLNTVKSHVRSIFRKLGVASRTEAVARARERRLL